MQSSSSLASGSSLPFVGPTLSSERAQGLRMPFVARRSMLNTAHGTVAYFSDTSGQGTPLLLVHSINAAASCYEMKPLFEAYRGRRPVYAIDLPGFGHSDRDGSEYSPQRFAGAISELVRRIARKGQQVDIIALSLGSELAARAALEVPELVRSLVFISPSGMGKTKDAPLMQRMAGSKALHGLLAAPLIGSALYRLLVTRTSIKYFLKKSFARSLPHDLVSYAYDTAHQPGARHAPLWFLSGALFNPRAIENLYGKLSQPTLVLHDRNPYSTFERLPALLMKSNVSAVRIAGTRGMPHFERLPETLVQLQGFYQAIG